ncbi:MAG: hypothetical protein ACREQ9_05890, partial [Candidatus Binatia bacterium]
LDALARLRPDERDPEIFYLAGVSAAMLGRWDEAERILGRLLPDDAEYGFGLYVRAQARIVRGDFRGALADLDGMSATETRVSAELLDQSRILKGKLLYLEERHAEARAAFGAVESGGSVGFEALRGLLLARSDADAASRVKVSESRPTDAATLLLVKAIAAEEREDAELATEIRERLRGVVTRRLRALERLSAAGSHVDALEEDLARFAGTLRRERWRSRWPQERALVDHGSAEDLPAAPPEPADRFEPKEGLFYEAWEQARSDPWLRGSIELLARSQELVADLEALPRRKPFWMFWRRDEDRRLAAALVVLRFANLEQLFADHLHTLQAISREELQERKKRSTSRAIDRLRRLYVGREAKIPAALSNLRLHLEYKEGDMRRLVESAPERSTDPVISLLGNLVDLLAETRARLADAEEPLPELEPVNATRIVEAIRSENAALGREIAVRIREVVDPTVRRQLAFFTRLAADNEGSLSRLYARTHSAGKAP